MAFKQLSVFIENKKGWLYRVTGQLSGAGVNIRAMSIADTTDFGILRMIVDNNDAALATLKANNYIVSENEVIGVSINDIPGALAKIMQILCEHDINVEYIYAFNASANKNAYVVLRVDNNYSAEKALRENGVQIITKKDID